MPTTWLAGQRLLAGTNKGDVMANGDTTQELEVSKGDAKLKIRGSDWLSLAGVAVGVLMVYMIFEHRQEARDSGVQFQSVVKEMNVGLREMVSEQKMQNCLIAYPQEQRERNIDFCRRLTR